VALAFEMPADALRGPTRGNAQVALARQAAMYLAHVVCGLTLTQAGEMFARDRTTVAHACTLVELRREDPNFDNAIDLLESIVILMTGPGGICSTDELLLRSEETE
jgi:chromosomal replication initiation ATPase DnaA